MILIILFLNPNFSYNKLGALIVCKGLRSWISFPTNFIQVVHRESFSKTGNYPFDSPLMSVIMFLSIIVDSITHIQSSKPSELAFRKLVDVLKEILAYHHHMLTDINMLYFGSNDASYERQAR